jgi:AraC-like DNA-binding protein
MVDPPHRAPDVGQRSAPDANDLGASLARFFPDHSVDMGPDWKKFRAEGAVASLGKVHIFRSAIFSRIRLNIRNSAYFAQGFPSQGTSETVNNGYSATNSSEIGASLEPGEVSFANKSEFRSNVVMVTADAMSQTVAALSGRNDIGRIELDRKCSKVRPELRLLRGITSSLSEELDLSHFSPIVLAELEQTILVSLACGISHNYTRLLESHEPDLAPHQVRRVENYIEANWGQPLSIQGLAVVASASARSVFQSFRIHRGYSPMKFVKTVRLRRAREMLQGASSDFTVTTVAFACGFGNLGHFARDYQNAFGETPSATLSRTKAANAAAPRMSHLEGGRPSAEAERVRFERP